MTEEFHELLFENSPDMISIHDGEGTVLDVNWRFCDVFDQPKEDLVGKKVWEIDRQADPDELREIWARMDVGDRLKVETEFASESGAGFPVEVHLVRLDLNGNSDRFMVISRDITTRKEQERQLREQNKRLNEFVSIMTHEIRNPLNIASGRLELISEECDSEHLSRIKEAHDRIQYIIEDMLELARDGRDIDSIEPVDFYGAIEAAWAVASNGSGELQIKTNDDTLQDTRYIEADYNRFSQLLENLFRNAIEHGSDDVTVTVGELANGFYVEDTGSGIPDGERDKVFDIGYSQSGGTGFGLSIVKRIATAHKWEIQITEGDSDGARFEITGLEFT